MKSDLSSPTTRPAASLRRALALLLLPLILASLACTLPTGLLIGIGPSDGTLVIDQGGNERINDALQLQQFTVAAGSKDGDFALTFHNGDGVLLPIVGDNGIISTDFGGNDQATALDRGANRLIAAGTSDQQIALAAYTQEGALDPTFGAGGTVLTTLPGGAVLNDLWVTEQDALFVAGTTEVSSVPHFLLVSYLADGSLNPGFGQNGVVTTTIGTSAQARVVKFDMAGNIVVAGHSTSASGEVLALARYLPDGSLDSSFGNSGIVTTSIPGGDAFAYDLRYQMDGKLLVAGEWRPSPSGDAQFMLARYLNDGTLDPDFDGGVDANGVILTAFSGASAAASSITINFETDVPEFVLAGFAVASGANEAFALAAYTADGSLDTRFGTGGLTTTSVGGASARVKKVLLNTDKLMAVGYSGTNFALARYNFPNGTLDPGFGRPSFVSTAITNAGASGASAVVVDPQGNRLLGGYSRNLNNPNDDFALARYTEGSALDPAFDTDGIVTTDFGGSSEYIEALVLHNDGGLVAAGYSNLGGSDQFALARYAADGSLDIGFGPQGTGFFTTPIGTLSRARALITLPDNRLIAAGHSQDAAGTGLALAAYTPDGSLDTTFGQGGIVTTTLPGGATYGVDLARHTDGSLVLVGRHEPTAPGLTHLVVARYTPTGSLDSAFGSAGIVTATLPSANVFGRAVLIQPDGKIVVGGDSQPSGGGNRSFLLLRYMPDGTLDPSFNNDGIVAYELDTAQGELRDLAVQRDGRLLVVGQADANILIGRFLLDDGALDTRFFGKQGWITQAVWQHQLQPAAIALIPDSHSDTVIVAGQSQGIAPVAASFYFHVQSLIEGNVAQVNPGQASPNLSGLSFQVSPDALAPCTYQVVRQPNPSLLAGMLDAVTFLGVSKIAAVNWFPSPSDQACVTGYDLKISYTDAEVMYSGGDERNLVPISFSGAWGDNLCLEHACTQDTLNNTLSIRNLKTFPLDLLLGFWLTEPVTARDVPAGRSIRSLPRLQIVNDSGQTCDFSATWRNVSPGGTRLGLGEMPYQWDLASTCSEPLRIELIFHYTASDLRRSNAVVQSDLKAYQFVNGVWVNQCGVYACTNVEDAGSFKVSGVASLGTWTLASSPPTTDPITGLNAASSSPTVLGQSTNFTATLSTGSNITYTWDFGDGVGTGSGAAASYTYTAAGVYTATVTASNPMGSQQAQTVVTVLSPITDLAATNNGPTLLGQSTAFSATVSAGSNITYTWDFGDGAGTDSGPMVSYTYTATGTYTATVTAGNGAGNQQAQTVVTIWEQRKLYLPTVQR